MKLSILSLYISILIFYGCNNTDKFKLNAFNVDKVESFKINPLASEIGLIEKMDLSDGKNELESKWNSYISNNGELTFNIPQNWEITKKEGTLMYCKYGNQENSFFVLLTYNKKEHSITFDSFLEAIMEDMESDTVNHFEINENFRGKSLGYNVNFFSTSMLESGQKSIGYSLITETDSLILDFSMKVMEEDYSEFSKVLFFLSAGSFKINGVPLFEQEESSSGLDFGIK